MRVGSSKVPAESGETQANVGSSKVPADGGEEAVRCQLGGEMMAAGATRVGRW